MPGEPKRKPKPKAIYDKKVDKPKKGTMKKKRPKK